MASKRIKRSASRLWPRMGEWVPAVRKGKDTATAGCPGCGIISTMYDHEIDEDGNVTPSVGCPGPQGNACYHETGVVLEGWAERHG